MDYEEYSPHWQEKVQALADNVLGVGYFAKPSEISREPDAQMILCTEDGQLYGFAQGRLLPKRGLQQLFEHRVGDVPADLDEADKEGALSVIQSVAVASQCRGKGIGTALLLRLHDLLIGHGADKLIATFKRGPGSSDIEGIMGRLGFEFWIKLDTYFRDRCNQADFKCADRTDQCNCAAHFYRKKIY